jgi:hypothetical protein
MSGRSVGAWTALKLSRAQPSPWFVARSIGGVMTGHYEQLFAAEGGIATFSDRNAAEAAAAEANERTAEIEAELRAEWRADDREMEAMERNEE